MTVREHLLDARDLRVVFKGRRGKPPVAALDGVSITIGDGETLGLVGESGSGKSTLGRAILGLNRVQSGSIAFDGHDLFEWRRRNAREVAAALQVVFQDPYSSLNPTQTVGQILAEPLQAHGMRDRSELARRVYEMLDRVGLASEYVDRYPRQFSGGQRQRIAIARSLMLGPKLIVCDEALSALDLSVQAQVANVLMELQRELGLSYLFIAHDLSIVRLMAHRTVVMRHGQIVEQGPTDELYSAPKHPYTQALLAAEPVPDPVEQRRRRQARAALAQRGPMATA
ncbi:MULTISPECIES: ATP-binding cassette domain-containing protein [unclassified Salinibacterium]|uniref:ATP-binding cassette domain-containing protein n=1 Tax=Salinibacterium sp. GXW1014 TaxID=3377838 RepID=UPI0019DD1BC4|nr:ATP-binding cassette domain-containing protein [Salinibacterium sp.]MBF0672412.1 ABC transporter ATP-binding protein [Salinibacterium sp.]